VVKLGLQRLFVIQWSIILSANHFYIARESRSIKITVGRLFALTVGTAKDFRFYHASAVLPHVRLSLCHVLSFYCQSYI